MNKRIILFFIISCFLFPLFSASLFIDGVVDEKGGIRIEQRVAGNTECSIFIPDRYIDLENDWDRWDIELSELETNGEISSVSGGYRVDGVSEELVVSYSIPPMKARGNLDEFYFYLPSFDSSIDKINLHFEFPKAIKGDVYILKATNGTIEKEILTTDGNIVQGTVSVTKDSDFALKALLDCGYFDSQNRVKDYSIIIVSILFIFALVILVFASLLKFKTKNIEIGEIGKNSKVPNATPFLTAVYSGSYISSTDLIISYLLYWQCLEVIAIETTDSGFKLRILKPLSDVSIEERQLFQLIFGSSAIADEKSIAIRSRQIKEFLSKLIQDSLKDSSFEDRSIKRKKVLLFGFTCLFAIVSGVLGSCLHFGVLTLVTLFCSLALFAISSISAKSYKEAKESLSILGKLRFSAFPLVCYLFLAGYYGYGFSVFSSSMLGFFSSFILSLGIFFGTFVLLGITKLDKSKKEVIINSLSYKEYLKGKREFTSLELPYAYILGINLTSSEYSPLIVSLRRVFVKIGIYGISNKK